MAQALRTGDGSLPHDLTAQNMYTELRQGSKKAVVVVRNNRAYPQTPPKENPSGQGSCSNHSAWATNGSPVAGGDEPQDPHTPKLTVRERYGRLFDELDLSGLDSWPLELADAAHWLLAKYHNVFSLDPMELGCTHSTEHTIKVTDDTPFKEWFGWVSLPLVQEVQNHLQEMLESGTIWPSQKCGVMLWCWSGRRMGAYGSASTSTV